MINYSISTIEEKAIVLQFKNEVKRLAALHKKNPHHYGDKSLIDLMIDWQFVAFHKAAFKQLARDKLAYIESHLDNFYTWDDYKGDMYCGITNLDISPKILKAQEVKERARFNKQGCFTYEIVVNGEVLEAISGFIGKDFYGSGYDDDFYRAAIQEVSIKFPEYVKEIIKCLPVKINLK